MKYSIIIACYNLGNLVRRAIESCINQQGIEKTFYEVIVLNDGSTDDTLDYILKYTEGQSNFKIIDKPNGGLSNTRNRGIKEASGDYVLFLDGDDWLSDETLLTLSNYIDGQDVIDFPMVYYYDEVHTRVQDLGLTDGVYSRDKFLHSTFGKARFDVIPSPKRAYRRDFLLRNNIQFVEGILHEDGPFFLDVMDKCDEITVITKPLYYYLQKREGSITSLHTLKNYQGVMDGIAHIETLSIANNPDVLLHNGHLLVYQITQPYKNKADFKRVCSELRTIKTKRRIAKILIKGTFEMKQAARLILVLIDPLLLGVLYRRI